MLAQSALRDFLSTPNPASVAATVETYPISNESKKALLDLLQNDGDYLADLSRTEKIELLRKTSYRDYLLKHIGATQEIADLLNDTTRGYWGVGWDALSALEGYRLGNPGMANLDIGKIEGDPPARSEPYIFHFPGGNSGIARSIVRQLLPRGGARQHDGRSGHHEHGLLPA